MIPLLGKLRTFFTLPTLVVLIFSVLASTAIGYYFRAQQLATERDGFRETVEQLVQTNLHNESQIRQLMELRLKDAEYYERLTGEISSITDDYGHVRRSLRQLEVNSNEIRSYFAIRVPVELNRLREEQRAARENRNSAPTSSETD